MEEGTLGIIEVGIDRLNGPTIRQFQPLSLREVRFPTVHLMSFGHLWPCTASFGKRRI